MCGLVTQIMFGFGPSVLEKCLNLKLEKWWHFVEVYR